MTKKQAQQMSNEDIIITLCQNYGRDTKQARKDESILISVLANRGIVNDKFMIEKMED